MFCAISGRPLKYAVFSPKSKCVFEKSLIESYVQENGIDPINKEALSVEELIEIAQTSEQYAMSNSLNSSTLKVNYSIPNLLSSLQDEWDAIVLENFQLRQQLEASKKELSTALYRCDAAMNVATRASLEAENLKQELSILTQNLAPAQAIKADSNNEEATDKLASSLMQEIIRNSQEFAKASRKVKFQPLPYLHYTADTEVIANISPNGKIESAFVNGNIANGKLVAFHSAEGSCNIISSSTLETGSLKSLLKQNEYLNFAAPLSATQVLFGTKSGKHGVYDLVDQQEVFTVLQNDDDSEVVMVSWIKEISERAYVVVNSNGLVSLADTVDHRVVDLKATNFRTTFAHLHKDGLLLLQGNDKNLIVQDLTDVAKAPIEYAHDVEVEGPILSAKFASNGYWLVLATASLLKIFDLRKKPNTLATETLVFTDKSLVAWDLDPSMKVLYLVFKDLENTDQCTLCCYEYNKPSKKWALKKSITEFFNDVSNLAYIWDSTAGYIKAVTSTALVGAKLD
ncbi:LANO_0F09208g1_1 [Lachancea nothofagi CBS 11611]|uniref:Pre-mRNA-processing factor 19 n=1 Tax=Lachancea nothofagi CBS 11611 TaxID=1266666 RepID=A0A1G4K9T2_9SACH|nr:LANO_0F09208g1_1 [Lachancea nothofagi CBS 11611]